MTIKKLGSILFLISACTASVDDMGPAGDDGDGGGDGDPGVGNDDIRYRLTSIHDERADQIEFSTGEPVHTHAGPTVKLGGSDCPDVYKHSYLMTRTAPQFGREAAPNPIAWTIEAKSAAEYRVRTGDDAAVLDWTAADGDTIELHRDVLTSGKYLLDVRVGASVATTCFILHPLAAPLEMQPAHPDAAGLPSMTFAAASPISRLFTGESVPVFTQQFAHHTAEPVELVIDVAKPTAMYNRRAVDEYVPQTVQEIVMCSNADGDLGEPVCNDTSPIPAGTAQVGAGPLTSGTWSLQIFDEATNAAAASCTVANLRATCKLAARAATAASQRYRVVLSVTYLPELAPFGTGGTIAEHTFAGQSFTGRLLETLKRCAEYKEVTKFGVTIVSCIKQTHYTRIQAIDTARIAFAPVAFSFASSPTAALAPLQLAPQGVPAYTWDAGDADLPGPQ